MATEKSRERTEGMTHNDIPLDSWQSVIDYAKHHTRGHNDHPFSHSPILVTVRLYRELFDLIKPTDRFVSQEVYDAGLETINVLGNVAITPDIPHTE